MGTERKRERDSKSTQKVQADANLPFLPEPQPKEKPLRTKRGHRKGSLLAGNAETPPPPTDRAPSSATAAAAAKADDNKLATAAQSPSSDVSRSHSRSRAEAATKASTNGAASSANGGGKSTAGKKTAEATSAGFELYCEEKRPELLEKAAEEEDGEEDDDNKPANNIEEELEKGWKGLSEEARSAYRDAAGKKSVVAKKEAAGRGERSSSSAKPVARDEGGAEDTPAADEDVEMGNYDSDQETQGEKQDE